MQQSRILLFCAVLLSALVADVGEGQTAVQDLHGDPLPRGAVARLGTMRFRHDSTIVFAAFFPDGKRILSLSDEGALRVWEFPSGKETHRVESVAGSAAMVMSATLSPDGKHLTASCSDGLLHIWDWANAREVGKVPNMGNEVRGLANTGTAHSVPVYSPDSKTLMLFGTSRALQLVDLPTGTQIGPSLGPTETLSSLWFTPDGGQIVTKGGQSTHTWSAATGKYLGTVSIKVPTTPGSPQVISPDGRIGVSVARFATPAAAMAAKEREAVLFDTASGKEIGTLTLDAELTPIHRKPILFSPDNKTLAICMGNAPQKIVLYEVPSGKVLRTLDAGQGGGPAAMPGGGLLKGKGGKGGGPGGFAGGGGFGGGGKGFGGGPVASTQKMLFSPDGTLIAFQSGRGAAIVVTDTATGRQLASLVPNQLKLAWQGAFTPDGRCLALDNSDGSVTLYELATGQPRCTFGSKLPQAVKGEPFDDFFNAPATRYRDIFAIAPDGKLLALAGSGGVVQIRDILTGREVGLFQGHSADISSLVFSPNGKTLASAGEATALIWDISKIVRPALPATVLKPGDLEKAWQALADNDAVKAYAAMGELAAAPKDSVAWIKAKVTPAPPLDVKRVEALIRELDDEQFETRDRASAALLKIGEVALPVLDKALAGDLSKEARGRLEQVRGKLMGTVLEGDALRVFRAVEVLEFIGTPQAREVLQTLAAGGPGALVTTSARAALKR